MKRQSLPMLVLAVGQQCSLNCEKCANFSPLLRKTFPFYDADDIISDVNQVTRNLAQIKTVCVQGGEFFIHPERETILRYLLSNPVIGQVQVASNGVFKISDELLEIMRNSKFVLRLSHYGDVNLDGISNSIRYLLKNGIRFFFHSYASGDGSWSDCGDVETPRLSHKAMLESYSKCIFQFCLTLENGIISRCSRAVVAHHVQRFAPQETDFINVREEFNVKDLLLYFRLRRFWPVTACYHCYGTNGNKIPAGQQCH